MSRKISCSTGTVKEILLHKPDADDIRYEPTTIFGESCEAGQEHFVYVKHGHGIKVGDEIELAVLVSEET